ncbi:MAG: APC family permease [Solirubrobacterales bacterium]
MSNAQASRGGRLRRNQLGTGGIVFLVIAAAAPLGAVVITVPLSIALGTGVGTPGAYVLAAIALGLFSAGYVAMSRHVTNVGAFYAYVSRGLGRPLGVATAMIALVAYNAMVIAVVVFVGVFANQVALAEFSIDLDWKVWSAIAFAIVAALSYFQIHLSAKVLGVALVCEVVVLLIMDFAILIDQGFSAYPLESFSPGTVFGAAAGVSIMYAFASFVGFEATAIYGEEAREPKRTVPRATYIAIGLIGVFYAFTTWSLVAAFGAGSVVEVAGEEPASFVFLANAEYVGGITEVAMSILVCTSLLAALLAFHNAAARYMYAIARDGILPAALARTHRDHGSPYLASAIQLLFTAIVVVACIVAGLDPLLEIGAAFLGLGTLSIVVLQSLASFSVVGFFRNRADRNPVQTMLAPLLGGIALAVAAVLVVDNYPLLTGASSELINHLWIAIPLAAAVGLAVAYAMRSSNPARYAALGTGEPPEDDETGPEMGLGGPATDEVASGQAPTTPG